MSVFEAVYSLPQILLRTNDSCFMGMAVKISLLCTCVHSLSPSDLVFTLFHIGATMEKLDLSADWIYAIQQLSVYLSYICPLGQPGC